MKKSFYPSYTHGKLDPQAEGVLQKIAELNGKPLSYLTPEAARKNSFEKSWIGESPDKILVKEIKIKSVHADIPLRFFIPEGKGPFPVLIYFHGGGFVTACQDEADSLCRRLSERVSCIVVSVDYRLAPEHKFPAAVEDSANSLRWVINNAAEFNGDPSRIAVGGASAGANLAVVSALVLRHRGFSALTFQALICPWVDTRLTETESYKFFGDGLWLSRATMNWYRNHYLDSENQALSYLASPILAEDFRGLPPTLIITAEFDVLRTEGEEFAKRLKAAGVPVKSICFEGMLHGFVTLPGIFSKAEKATDEICNSLRNAFES